MWRTRLLPIACPRLTGTALPTNRPMVFVDIGSPGSTKRYPSEKL